MALTSTLGSPGIEIREVDNSYRLDSSTATTVYIPGFTSQGPVDEVMSISSIADFETIYGIPTNAAERYFYYTVKAVLDNSGAGVTVLCSRLPYGSGAGDTVTNAYTLLAYPAIPVIKKKHEKETPMISNGVYKFISDNVTVAVKKYLDFQDKSLSITPSEGEIETISVAIDDNELTYQGYKIVSSQLVENAEDEEKKDCVTEYILIFADANVETGLEVSIKLTTRNKESEEISDLCKDIEGELQSTIELTYDKLIKETVTGTIDFDKMVFSQVNTNKLASLFTVLDTDDTPVTPEIEDITFVIDDDYEIESLKLTAIEGATIP
jgi:hypothetical protein